MALNATHLVKVRVAPHFLHMATLGKRVHDVRDDLMIAVYRSMLRNSGLHPRNHMYFFTKLFDGTDVTLEDIADQMDRGVIAGWSRSLSIWSIC